MARKQRWPPVLSQRDQERREKLSSHVDDTTLRVCKAEASKQEQRKMKFCKPHWPPVISAEECEKRRFRESLEDGSEATPSTSKQWPLKMKTAKVSIPPCASLAVLPAPPAVTDTALKRVPRATAWRRRKRAIEDKKAVKHGRATARRRDPKGYPCGLCGKPKRLEFGHSFYRGKHFCATAAGRSVSDWRSEQKRLAAADNVRDVPRTTAWRRKKREEAIAEGLSEKQVKDRKIFTCSQRPKSTDTHGTLARPSAAPMRAKLWNFGWQSNGPLLLLSEGLNI
ncbi:uncharacterized protein LOC125277565 [Megalobrama amblycephala]|uniref:uncharacterized protein LOC125277565 n=1 Tax=Megalobrama amblycephala TaxID=75352 RepID=UPI0020144A83|nr:uncharacterized protein LOC125277565 [Megalobrama amblycephala]